ncbi:MAG: hypothetical protein O6928_07500 [Gammaproteobacteria bacterium]|nr:hypothetical protein [Gammaproteobacteria bacterium]
MLVPPAQYGPSFNALLVYLNQQQLLPAERTAQLLKDIFDHKVSQGTTNGQLISKTLHCGGDSNQ